ncbi:MAG TPA: hypothetical protein PK289_00070 [Bacteroidia bacterium]|nr:hypothetical protein [Bacteroidia bacterium]
MAFTSSTGENVLLYGFKGDGVTDNSSVLAAMFSMLPTGSEIHFPAGIFFFNSSTAVSNKQFFITGCGMSSIIKTASNISIINISSTAAAASKWKVDNLNFQGNDTGAGQYALNFSSKSGSFVVNNCWFSDFGAGAISVGNTEDSTRLGGLVSGCKFFSNNIGVDIVTRGEYIQIIGSDFFSNTKGIQTAGGNTLIDGCNVNYNVTGIEFITGANNGHSIVSNCNINHNTTYSLNLHDTTLGISINDCHIYQGTLRIKDTTGVVFSGGVIDATAYTFDTNSGLRFNGVSFDTGYANTITLIGTAPIYFNCSKLNGGYAYDADNFGATIESIITTTNASVTTLQTIPANTSSTITVSGYVTARRTGGTAGTTEDGATYRVEFSVKNVSGTATLIGSAITVIGESQAGWDVTLTGSTSNILIQVTGAVDNNIIWKWTTTQYVKI